MSVYENDLSKMGYREIELLQELLTAYIKDKSKLRDNDIKGFGFNACSGNVWLESEDYNCYMINPESGLLEEFLSTPYYGNEGYYKDLVKAALKDDGRWNADEYSYLLELNSYEPFIFELKKTHKIKLKRLLKGAAK